MKTRILKIACAVTLCMAFPVMANASVLSNALTFNGISDTLKDDSIGRVVDVDGNGFISSGDVIQGFILFDEVEQDLGADSEPLGGQVWGIYSLQVAGIGPGGVITMTTVSTAATHDGLSLEDIIATSAAGSAGIDTNGLTVGSGASIAIFSSETDSEGSTTALDAVSGDAGDGLVDSTTGLIAGQFGSAWSLDVILGPTGSDFYEIELGSPGGSTAADTNDDGVGDTAFDVTDISHLAGGSYLSIGSSVSVQKDIAQYSTALTVTDHDFSPATIFIDEGATKFSDGSTVLSDVAANENDIKTIRGGDGRLDLGWHFQDDGDFFINTIPEPGTVAIWSVIGLGLAGYGVRRRRMAKKA